MVKCLACDEVFLLPKDARVLPSDPLITLPSCLGARRPIKLEYLPDGSDACPLVRLYDFDTDGVCCLRDTFRSLAEGTLHVNLQDVIPVESVDGCTIRFTRAKSSGVVQVGHREFEVLLSPEGWRQAADLTEAFCEGGFGFQWLTDYGKIQLLLSKTGEW